MQDRQVQTALQAVQVIGLRNLLARNGAQPAIRMDAFRGWQGRRSPGFWGYAGTEGLSAQSTDFNRIGEQSPHV